MKTALLLAACLVVGATAPTRAGAATAPPARVIVKLKDDAPLLRQHALAAQTAKAGVIDTAQRRADVLGARLALPLAAGRMLDERTQVVKAAGLSSQALAARLAAQADVEWAVVDRRQRFHYLPNDPLFGAGPPSGQGPDAGQWYLRAPTQAIRSAINAQAAWDHIKGTASVVVAVIDTGVLATHPDLSGRVLAGYDMISDADVANDGNGRDVDATDAGDWITTAESEDALGPYKDCEVGDSSWHGTIVSGIIGATGDNGVGMAGAAYGVRILPVRVLGKCGGYDSDIIAGMKWAAGISVPGVPANANVARVLNLSLGSEASCSVAYSEAVQAVRARGAAVVAAAGNSTGRAVGEPANCAGVIGVAGLRHAGSKVGFSDLGAEITISAPGGNCVNIGAGEPCLYPIASSTNSGTTSVVAGGMTYSDSYNYSVGTSFATPLVAATAALIVAARPTVTSDQITALLRHSARPFPTSGADNGTDPTPVPACRAPDSTDQLQCYCSTGLCGAGMLDAAAAVQATLLPTSVDERARQLLDYAERSYADYFPDRLPTQSSDPFLYRYYPTTGVYLGVVVKSGTGWPLDGVYVMGGPFGDAPLYVGQLTSFVTPTSKVP